MWNSSKPALTERFMAKVMPEPMSGCWLWTGAVDQKGYGRTSGNIGNGHFRNCTAHRVSYSLFVGEIPKRMYVLHACDVRTCVNPDHLWIGTNDENMADMVRKNRTLNGQKTHCKHGHEFTDENTYINKPTGKRSCRECGRLRDKTRRTV